CVLPEDSPAAKRQPSPHQVGRGGYWRDRRAPQTVSHAHLACSREERSPPEAVESGGGGGLLNTTPPTQYSGNRVLATDPLDTTTGVASSGEHAHFGTEPQRGDTLGSAGSQPGSVWVVVGSNPLDRGEQPQERHRVDVVPHEPDAAIHEQDVAPVGVEAERLVVRAADVRRPRAVSGPAGRHVEVVDDLEVLGAGGRERNGLVRTGNPIGAVGLSPPPRGTVAGVGRWDVDAARVEVLR